VGDMQLAVSHILHIYIWFVGWEGVEELQEGDIWEEEEGERVEGGAHERRRGEKCFWHLFPKKGD